MRGAERVKDFSGFRIHFYTISHFGHPFSEFQFRSSGIYVIFDFSNSNGTKYWEIQNSRVTESSVIVMLPFRSK